MTKRMRLDAALVERCLVPSRTKAREAIAAGGVRLNGEICRKPAQTVLSGDAVECVPAYNWVSRGGMKLDYALNAFRIDAQGRTCLDIGASTGGFTDVLLARGAAHVVAVDVGSGQLHPRLRVDPRVSSREQTDARRLKAEDLPAPPSLLVCDASFISLTKLLGRALSLCSRPADAVVLFKPQFEVGREAIGKNGRVKDEHAIARALEANASWFAREGWRIVDQCESPIRGGEGAVEHLLHAVRSDGSPAL